MERARVVPDPIVLPVPSAAGGYGEGIPLLVRIVSEYTAGFDPEILSARVPTATAIESMGSQSAEVAVAPTQKVRTLKKTSAVASAAEKKQKDEQLNEPRPAEKKKSESPLSSKPDPVSVKPTATEDTLPKRESSLVSTDDPSDRKMVSVLPSFKPGKCFFCSKNDAEHFVPACGMWGKWTHWRMNQQHNMNTTSIAAASSGAALSKGAVTVSMCTSYYDLQNDKSKLEARVQGEEKKMRI